MAERSGIACRRPTTPRGDAVMRAGVFRFKPRRAAARASGATNAEAIGKAGKALAEKITAWEETLVQPRGKTFQDEINFRNQLSDQYLFLEEAIDGTEPPVTDAARQRVRDLETAWAKRKGERDAVVQQDVPAFNALFKDAGLPAIVVPPAKQ